MKKILNLIKKKICTDTEERIDFNNMRKQYHIKKRAIDGAVILYLNIPEKELSNLPECIKPMWRIGKRLWKNEGTRAYLSINSYWVKDKK